MHLSIVCKTSERQNMYSQNHNSIPLLQFEEYVGTEIMSEKFVHSIKSWYRIRGVFYIKLLYTY